MDCLFSFPFFLRGDGWLMVQFETLTKMEHLRSSFILNDIYMLFTGREVRIGKNCARGLEYGPRPQAEGRTQDQGHSFSLYGPT